MTTEPLHTSGSFDITAAIPIFAWDGLRDRRLKSEEDRTTSPADQLFEADRNPGDLHVVLPAKPVPHSSPTSEGVSQGHVVSTHWVVANEIEPPAPPEFDFGNSARYVSGAENSTPNGSTHGTGRSHHESLSNPTSEITVGHALGNGRDDAPTFSGTGQHIIAQTWTKIIKTNTLGPVPCKFYLIEGSEPLLAPPNAVVELGDAPQYSVLVYNWRDQPHHATWIKRDSSWIAFAEGEQMADIRGTRGKPCTIWVPSKPKDAAGHPKPPPSAPSWVQASALDRYKRTDRQVTVNVAGG
ncbi:hypothetical protein EXIGLDRAFT_779173 [Exidia glandulosa HHB12029]|uniref:Uncharacterized protein n=1 Tax=Exidia glandulosa HHB12029 TaxID=1314781 RepID=A0A165C6H0_EXIGL|nr:hypothetical protein EXIGLDRAFT_779173 [Exidia glandulosa HHB12029]